jgi:hypothetical protein
VFIDLSEKSIRYEPLGTKEKEWIENDGQKFLYKQGRKGTGEDWAEVVTSAICDKIKIPHADYCLAQNSDKKYGVLTKSLVPKDGRLILVNELLKKIYKNYDPEKKYNQKDYRLTRIQAFFKQIKKILEPPRTFELTEQINTALDVFIGYLMLDALIGNQDRHHENWGLITDGKHIYLAETFDHASSLGRNNSEQSMQILLTTEDNRRNIYNFCNRAKTPFFKNKKILSTIETFKIVASWNPKAAKNWQQNLELLSENVLNNIFTNLPDVQNAPTEIQKIFAIKLILINKQRILDIKND